MANSIDIENATLQPLHYHHSCKLFSTKTNFIISAYHVCK